MWNVDTGSSRKTDASSHVTQLINLIILCGKCYLFLISEFNWKDFVTRNEFNKFFFVPDAVDVLGYVLRVV